MPTLYWFQLDVRSQQRRLAEQMTRLKQHLIYHHGYVSCFLFVLTYKSVSPDKLAPVHVDFSQLLHQTSAGLRICGLDQEVTHLVQVGLPRAPLSHGLRRHLNKRVRWRYIRPCIKFLMDKRLIEKHQGSSADTSGLWSWLYVTDPCSSHACRELRQSLYESHADRTLPMVPFTVVTSAKATAVSSSSCFTCSLTLW